LWPRVRTLPGARETIAQEPDRAKMRSSGHPLLRRCHSS